jgi:murein DD-endopeptidase MepM/ murein hydrolase activator NlpD
MQIIFVSNRFSTAKTLVVTTRHLVLWGIGLVLLIVALAGSLSYLTLRHAAQLKMPFLQDALAAAQQAESQRTQDFVRDNLKAIASKVGQLQAQMLHLDSLGERLSTIAGVKPGEVKSGDAKALSAKPAHGGQGGPLLSTVSYRMSAEELGQEVDRMLMQAETQTDYMSIVETALMDARIARNRLPTVLPVNALWNASMFGWRSDPFTGQRAMHEGVDFSAPIGTGIVSAANGVVLRAEPHPDYGLMVEIDHGNDYTTRYAHCSRLLVKVGQLVKRGQKVAEVGSTGRSTGPHLHFEVRNRGAAVNPSRFLPRTGDISGRPAFAVVAR